MLIQYCNYIIIPGLTPLLASLTNSGGVGFLFQSVAMAASHPFAGDSGRGEGGSLRLNCLPYLVEGYRLERRPAIISRVHYCLHGSGVCVCEALGVKPSIIEVVSESAMLSSQAPLQCMCVETEHTSMHYIQERCLHKCEHYENCMQHWICMRTPL